MPPKRKQDRSQSPKTSASTSTGRGRGGSTASKTKKLTVRECTFLLIDIGKESSNITEGNKTAIQRSKEIADWIVTRRIFADSDKYINLACHPVYNELEGWDIQSKSTGFLSYAFEKPLIKQIKMIKALKANETKGSNIIEGIEQILEMLESNKSSICEDKITIAILSNFTSLSADKNKICQISNRLNALNITLMFIGDDTTQKNDGTKEEIAKVESHQVLAELKSKTMSSSCSFANALNEVSFFSGKQKQIRGYPFEFELSENLKLSVQMFVKVAVERFAPKMDLKTTDGRDVVKVRRYEKHLEVKVGEDDYKELPISVDKSEIIKGYHYGSSIIPFSKADEEFAAIEKEGKQLQLIMFTKKENILPHFLMSECRWLLPNKKDKKAPGFMKGLVLSMLKTETVAIVRYAYNITSKPKTAVLFPKLTKNGCPVFEHFTLPFNEDIRGFEFPELDKVCDEPTDYQIDTMEAYIDQYMLINEIKDEKGKQKIERMKIKEIRNPQTQHLCMVMKRKLLNESEELGNGEHNALLEMLSAPSDIVKSSEKIMKLLAKSFDLKVVEKAKDSSSEAGYIGRTFREMNADSDEEDLKQPKTYDDMDIGMY